MDDALNIILRKASKSPESLSDADFAELRRISREHPADALAPALLLKYAPGMLTDQETAYARARVSLYCSAPSTLILSIDPSGKGFNTFYPPMPSENRPSTVGAIDLFLETYGHQSAEEDALLERMIFNPVPDYAEQLASQESVAPAATASGQDALIEAFIASHSENTKNPEKSEKSEKSMASESLPPHIPEPPKFEQKIEQDLQNEKKVLLSSKKLGKSSTNSSLLSESLAKIFIKQGRYERAYEIISNLNLNYPEKSIYFADQLRFLEKLIINQRYAPARPEEAE